MLINASPQSKQNLVLVPSLVVIGITQVWLFTYLHLTPIYNVIFFDSFIKKIIESINDTAYFTQLKAEMQWINKLPQVGG